MAGNSPDSIDQGKNAAEHRAREGGAAVVVKLYVAGTDDVVPALGADVRVGGIALQRAIRRVSVLRLVGREMRNLVRLSRLLDLSRVSLFQILYLREGLTSLKPPEPW